MAEGGWIKLHRCIRSNWIWNEKPFSRGQAFLDLLLTVNHEDKKIIFNGTLTEIKRGSGITSLRKLSEKWGWSKNKVKHFLDQLQLDEMLFYKSDTKKTLITIENYSIYQGRDLEKGQQEDTNEPPKENKKETDGKQKDTNKNDKESNKNEKKDKKYIVISEFTKNKELIQTIIDFMKMRDKLKKPMTDRALELMLKKLQGLSEVEEIQIKILENSIENCWQGIFPLKEDRSGSTKQNTRSSEKKFNVKIPEWKPGEGNYEGDEPI
ncbi:hypothetical protein ACUH7Y_09465 [Clostridium beijerinckii]|uniref:hypothetical protein n=1 Tax=Clostridium beijerinckii TaxID=1520 RepID=UPI00198262D7|nr:hypothetical protein [Clostridium beijerinckii]